MIFENKFQKLYDKLRVQSDKKLNLLLSGRKPTSLYVPAAYIIRSGGKRLRPLLLLLSLKAAGGKTGNGINAAAAVELLHNFTLVHDDIMDEADKRRGRPTLHKKYDLSTAILSGDSLLAVAYEALLQDCKDNSKEIVKEFTVALTDVCEGQSFDKDFELRNNVSIDEYIFMIGKKTAALLKMCCKTGALLAGAPNSVVKAFGHYGENLGIAFQIQDDYLDIFGEEKEIGKIPGGDIVQGKKTFLYLKAVSRAGVKERKLLNKITGKGITYKEVPLYRKLYDDLNIPFEAKRDIEHYSQVAMNALSFLDSENKRLFEWLTGTLINRNK